MLKQSKLLLYCIITSFLVLLITSHSTFATKGYYCANQVIAIDQSIMGPTAIADDQGRYVVATRANGDKVPSGSTYIPGENLIIAPSVFSVDILMQATGIFYY